MAVSELPQIDLTQGILFHAQSLASMCQEAKHVSSEMSSEILEDIDMANKILWGENDRSFFFCARKG